MLSKTKYTQLAAVAALTVLLGTSANMTAAQAQGGQPQMEKQQSGSSGGQSTRSGESRESGAIKGSGSVSGSVREGGSTQMRTDRSRDRSSTQTTVRRDRDFDRDRTRVSIRDRDRDRDHFRFRGRESFAAFVVIGPRHHYRPGWCRGLHRGKHWAPGAGWHAGRHVGLFRC